VSCVIGHLSVVDDAADCTSVSPSTGAGAVRAVTHKVSVWDIVSKLFKCIFQDLDPVVHLSNSSTNPTDIIVQ